MLRKGARFSKVWGFRTGLYTILMDKACEGNETRQLALDLGFIPVVPHCVHALSLGSTTTKCTSVVTKSSGCSAA